MRLALVVVLFACGGGSKPAPLAQVPIHDGTQKGNDDVPQDPIPADQTPIAEYDAGAPAVDAGKKTGELSAAECTSVIKKYATMVHKENKLPGDPAQLDLESHPLFGGMLGQCQQETTKKQYKCAMATKTTAAWQKCLQ